MAASLAACGPAPSSGVDGGLPDGDGALPDGGDATVDGALPTGPRCIGEDGADLGPLDPPVDACALSASDPEDALAAAACLARGPFERGEFDFPNDLLVGDVTARRFGVPSLSGLWDAYEALLLDSPSREVRLYARIADLTSLVSPDDLEGLASVDAVTMPALHCQYIPPPADYADRLVEALPLGGYETSHVLLALLWLDDNGCESPVDASFHEEALAATAALIDDDHTFANDLEIEAGALLEYLGEGHRIPAGFLDAVLLSQQEGGSFSPFSVEGLPNGHTSGLALWYLHEVLFPGRTAMPMITRCLRTEDAPD